MPRLSNTVSDFAALILSATLASTADITVLRGYGSAGNIGGDALASQDCRFQMGIEGSEAAMIDLRLDPELQRTIGRGNERAGRLRSRRWVPVLAGVVPAPRRRAAAGTRDRDVVRRKLARKTGLTKRTVPIVGKAKGPM